MSVSILRTLLLVYSGVGSLLVALVSVLAKQVHNIFMLQMCKADKVRVQAYQ